MNNNVIQPIGDISFDTIKKFFSLKPDKNTFWQEMLSDFQGIYSTINWETAKYYTVLKTVSYNLRGRILVKINNPINLKNVEQEFLLSDTEKFEIIDDLKSIQNKKIINKLDNYKDMMDSSTEDNYKKIYLEVFNALIPLLYGQNTVVYDDFENIRKYLPYSVKQYQKNSNNKTRMPFVQGSIVSSRTTNNQFVLVGAFKLILYTKSKIFKVFIYKKLKSATEGKFDYIIIFNYGEIVDFNEDLYLDCIKSICLFIKQVVSQKDESVNNIMLAGHSMGGNMAIQTLINLAREFQYPIDKLYAISSAYPNGLNEANLQYLNENLNGHYVSFMAMGNHINSDENNSSELTSKNISTEKVKLNSFFYKSFMKSIKTLVFLYKTQNSPFTLSKNLYNIEDVETEFATTNRKGSNTFHNLQLIFKGIKEIIKVDEPFEFEGGGKRNTKYLFKINKNKTKKEKKKYLKKKKILVIKDKWCK